MSYGWWLASSFADGGGAFLAYELGQDRLIAKLTIGLILGMVGLLIWRHQRQADQRGAELRALAKRMRLQYDSSQDFFQPQCPAFQHGQRRRTLHTLHGEFQRRILQLGDYEFDTQLNETPLQPLAKIRSHPFSYVQLQQPGAIFEAVVLQPRPAPSIPDAALTAPGDIAAEDLLAAVGGQLVEIPDPTLAERYLLVTEDPAYARALFTPALVALLHGAPPRMLYFGVWGLTVVQGAHCWPAGELEAVADFAARVVDALPPAAFHRQTD